MKHFFKMIVKDHFLSGEEFSLEETEHQGILKTSPLPSNLSKYYESKNYISHHQDEGTLRERIYKIAQNFNLNYKRHIVARQLQKGAKLLDYGCGAGDFLKFIKEDFSVLGYEPNDSAREIAASKIGEDKIISQLEEIEDHSLVCITLWHVLEHIENQEDTLKLFHKKLKNNGLLVIAVPNHTSFDAQFYKANWAAYDVPRHVYHFSKAGMQKYFNNTYWKLEKIKPLLLDSYYISIMSEKYKKNPLFWLKGSIVGAISNFKALKTDEFSSLIYLIRKK